MIWSALHGDMQLPNGGLRLTTSSEHKDQNKQGYCIGAILGVTKLVMNAADLGYVAVDTMRSNN
jgi:hypothetical protein